MSIFVRKKIISTEIIDEDDADAVDEIMNYAIGHMMGGYDGVMHANLLDESANTTFLITYNDGTTVIKTVQNNSIEYKKYFKFIKDV